MRSFIPRVIFGFFLGNAFAFLISGATMAAVSASSFLLRRKVHQVWPVYGAAVSETLVVQGNPSLQMDGNIERDGSCRRHWPTTSLFCLRNGVSG